MLPHQNHHQPFRPVDAEDQNLLDIGRAARAGDDQKFAAEGRIGCANSGEVIWEMRVQGTLENRIKRNKYNYASCLRESL